MLAQLNLKVIKAMLDKVLQNIKETFKSYPDVNRTIKDPTQFRTERIEEKDRRVENVHFGSKWLESALTENSLVSGASLKKAEIFYGYFDIYSGSK